MQHDEVSLRRLLIGTSQNLPQSKFVGNADQDNREKYREDNFRSERRILGYRLDRLLGGVLEPDMANDDPPRGIFNAAASDVTIDVLRKIARRK